jgi:hypothetical protein
MLDRRAVSREQRKVAEGKERKELYKRGLVEVEADV